MHRYRDVPLVQRHGQLILRSGEAHRHAFLASEERSCRELFDDSFQCRFVGNTPIARNFAAFEPCANRQSACGVTTDAFEQSEYIGGRSAHDATNGDQDPTLRQQILQPWQNDVRRN